jgi:hypothetical protein
VFFDGNDTVRDFLIKNSSIGAAPDGMGGDFAGNGFSGFEADGSQFFGVAFLNSSFNGNGTAGAGFGDGIFFVSGSTIEAGTVTLDDSGATLTTGLTVENSQIVGNSASGFQFRDVTADDVTIKDTDIAANARHGVFFDLSTVSDFAIQNSRVGEVLDATACRSSTATA